MPMTPTSLTLRLSAPLLVLALAGCVTQQEQNAAIGAVAGGALGAAVSSDDDRTQGLLLGAAAGAIAGSLIGPAQTTGQCRYRDASGNIFIAACP
jgi:Glycine zipper 2TM domain